MKYLLIEHEGHLLIQVEGLRYLIDTGSPWSLGNKPLHLCGREFAMQQSDLMGNNCESIAVLAGFPFDGLIGTDILGEFDLEISLQDRTLILSDALLEMSNGETVEMVEGVPLVSCVVNGKPSRMFVDTGAPLSYLSKGRVQGCRTLGEKEDFHPLFGRFQVPTFSIPVNVWGQSITIRMGQMPAMMEAALSVGGGDGVLGTEVLKHGILRLSQRQGRANLDVKKYGVRDMSINETVRRQRPPIEEPKNDAPRRLRELADVEKASAIADGFMRSVGGRFVAEIDSVHYDAFSRLREFRQPAQLCCTVHPIDDFNFSSVQRVPELEIERAIARSLSDAANEEYRVTLVNKRYAGRVGTPEFVRVTLQVGRVWR